VSLYRRIGSQLTRVGTGFKVEMGEAPALVVLLVRRTLGEAAHKTLGERKMEVVSESRCRTGRILNFVEWGLGDAEWADLVLLFKGEFR
jgi:hypothetical protein